VGTEVQLGAAEIWYRLDSLVSHVDYESAGRSKLNVPPQVGSVSSPQLNEAAEVSLFAVH
jgi:hypothetical protein